MARHLVLLCALTLLQVAFTPAQERRRTSAPNRGRMPTSYQVTGIVVLDDGSPAPEPAEVILSCSGVIRKRTHSQAGGQFSITLGYDSSPDPESPETPGVTTGGEFRTFNQIGRGFGDDGRFGSGRSAVAGRLYLGDCELFASLPGFTSEVVYPGNRGSMENPDVGSIRLHRRTRVRGTTVSLKSLAAPEKATNAYAKARNELRKKKVNYSKAIKELQKAVGLYPEFASAWYYMGISHLALEESDLARQAYERSAAADPDFLLPYLALAELHLQTGQFGESAAWSGRAIERNPRLMRASYLYGYANLYLGNLDAAEASARKVQSSPEVRAYPGIHHLLGEIFASRGNLSMAAAEFRRFLELNPSHARAEALRRQLSDWAQQGLIEKQVTDSR